jgi:anaerobic dimethyl sulfoxide reductase subunit C (anchor subunit)
MKRSEPRRAGGFHELPLAFFTALTIGGAGLAAAWLLAAMMGWVPLAPPTRILALVTALLAVGFLISIGHLGRRSRGHLALIRVGRSPLSNEVLLVALALSFSGTGIFLAGDTALYGPLSLAGLACALLLLPTLGSVYNIPGQLSWTGPSLIQPLILGLGIGLTYLLQELPEGALARGELMVLVVFMVDGLLVWERTRRLGVASTRGLPVYPGILRRRGALFSLRLSLGILLPASALLWGWRELALLGLSLNLLLDRVLFYGLAMRESTEAGLMRVSALLETESKTP